MGDPQQIVREVFAAAQAEYTSRLPGLAPGFTGDDLYELERKLLDRIGQECTKTEEETEEESDRAFANLREAKLKDARRIVAERELGRSDYFRTVTEAQVYLDRKNPFVEDREGVEL